MLNFSKTGKNFYCFQINVDVYKQPFLREYINRKDKVALLRTFIFKYKKMENTAND